MTVTSEAPAITFGELVENGQFATSHKYGGDTLVALGIEDCVDVTGLPFNSWVEGACLSVGGLTLAVKHPRWRAWEGDANVRTGDFMQMHIDGTPDSGTLPLAGTEPEGFVINSVTGETVDVADPNDPHPEFFRHMIEEATRPVTGLFALGLVTYEAYQQLWKRAQAADVLFYPGSNIAHRAATLADVHPNRYVQRIGAYMGGVAGMERTLYYDCASFQVTTGSMYPYGETVAATNLFQATISPLLGRFTAASFAARGTLHPRFPEPLSQPPPVGGYLQTRGLARRVGSPEGGILQPLPDTAAGFKQLANQRMRTGTSPAPGRVGGLHPDIRLRPEYGPAGAVEFCAMDTNGGHIESNMAIAAFLQAYMSVIPRAYATGDIQRLARQYPNLVAATVGQENFSLAEANSLILSQDIPNIRITTIGGRETSPEALWKEAIRMVATEAKGTPFELSDEAQSWLRRRAETPSVTDMPKDATGFIDIATFYRGGPGTAAHYQKALCKQLITAGFTEADAIREVQIRTARAHERYVAQFNPERSLAFLKTREEGRT